MEFHEYANIFPMMTPDEHRSLVEDMRTHGYDNTAPIMLFEGKILDGRNRYRAAIEAGVEPVYGDYGGDDGLAYVIRHNLHRRHLTESQRAVVASRLANMRRGDFHGNQHVVSANLPIPESQPISQAQAADMLNVSARTIRTVNAIERSAPDLIPAIERGEMTAHEALKKARQNERQEQRHEMARAIEDVPMSNRWNVYHDDMRTWQAPRQYDAIITDPPYPREFLPLYEVLAERATEWLKPGGLLIAMAGQSYLDQIYTAMSKHLTYYWTAAYLTPGQSASIRHVNVNTNWKPLLIYRHGDYNGRFFGDVCKSDGNDKDFHMWGQSISGMTDIVQRFALAGQYILDPFCGAGTTGIAALMHGCYFDGVELLEENANISRRRLHDSEAAR